MTLAPSQRQICSRGFNFGAWLVAPYVAFRRLTRDAHLLDQPFGYCAGAARASPTDEEAAHNVLWRCGYVCELRSLPAQHPRVRMPQQWLSVR